MKMSNTMQAAIAILDKLGEESPDELVQLSHELAQYVEHQAIEAAAQRRKRLAIPILLENQQNTHRYSHRMITRFNKKVR